MPPACRDRRSAHGGDYRRLTFMARWRREQQRRGDGSAAMTCCSVAWGRCVILAVRQIPFRTGIRCGSFGLLKFAI